MAANAMATREPPKVEAEKRHPHDLFFDSIVCSPAGKNEFVIFNNDTYPFTLFITIAINLVPGLTITKLKEMGFSDENVCIAALDKEDGDLGKAIDRLFNPDPIRTPPKSKPDFQKDASPSPSTSSSVSLLTVSLSDDDDLKLTRPSSSTSALIKSKRPAVLKAPEPEKDMECTICYSEFPASEKGVWVKLKCDHKLCSVCHERITTKRKTMSGVFKTFCKCPYCGVVDGIEIGTCPDGQMTKTLRQGWITVSYTITDPAHQTMRTTFFPNTPEGRRVVELMEVAWDRRLVFSIGTSMTTCAQNTVIWNIHHKTVLSGGAANHGYPDPGYLARVTVELEERGVC